MSDILIIGGTGKTGRRVAAQLRALGKRPRVSSRTGGDVRLDLGDPSTWQAALDGVEAAYVVEPVPQADGAGRQRIPDLIDHAVSAGVERVVLLTAPGVEGDPGHPLWPAEQAVKQSALEWTIVRPTWFAQNFSEDFWLPGVLAGELALPMGDGAVPFVDADDIAAVVTAALISSNHHGQVYDLSGPAPLTFFEAAAAISSGLGRLVRYTATDPTEFVQQQTAQGVPEDVADQLARLYAPIRSGDAAEATDGVERALGRSARSFEDYVTAACRAGAWAKR